MENGLLLGLIVLAVCFIANGYYQGGLIDDNAEQIKKLRQSLISLEQEMKNLSATVREVQDDIEDRR